jgi:hypothetical protein
MILSRVALSLRGYRLKVSEDRDMGIIFVLKTDRIGKL